MSSTKNIIGIDLGGTSIRVGLVSNYKLVNVQSCSTPSQGSKEEVLDAICSLIEYFLDQSVGSIGIGVPSIVDVEKGIVYDVVNIPAWNEVHLKEILEKRYHIPVFVNNDANCFTA